MFEQKCTTFDEKVRSDQPTGTTDTYFCCDLGMCVPLVIIHDSFFLLILFTKVL